MGILTIQIFVLARRPGRLHRVHRRHRGKPGRRHRPLAAALQRMSFFVAILPFQGPHRVNMIGPDPTYEFMYICVYIIAPNILKQL
jgi:hypothetical protein